MLKPFWWTRRCEMISDGESRGVFWSLVSWCGRRANVVVCQGLCGGRTRQEGRGCGRRDIGRRGIGRRGMARLVSRRVGVIPTA